MGQCYILLGPEKGLKEDFIKKIKTSIGSCEVSKFYAFDDYEEEMLSQLNNIDLFAEHKLVILDEAQEIKTKEKSKPIVEFIKNPSENASLILTSTELYINPDIMAAIPNQKDNIVKFYELFENQKNEWLRNFFRRNNMMIDISACNAICEKVENNISEFENTCSQMVIYFKTIEGKQTITYQDVEDFLTHTREEDEFSLFSYIAQGKLEAALECLKTLINIGDAYLIPALPSRLAVFFRRLFSIQMLMATKGISTDDAFKTKFFDSDRNISMPKDKDTYRAALKNYTLKDTQRILMLLSDYDILVKEEGPIMQQVVLEQCISTIIVHKGMTAPSPAFATI